MTFWMLFFGFLTVISAAGVVLCRNPLNSALSLIVTLFMVAVHYAILGADFLSAVQVMVYAGAIMVLVVFVIMLLGSDVHVPEGTKVINWVAGGLLSAGIFAILAVSICRDGALNAEQYVAASDVISGDAKVIGSRLFTDFLFPFEMASLLILSAIIGAVTIGAEDKRALKAGRGLKAMRDRAELEIKKAA